MPESKALVLPTEVRPLKYTITLAPDLEKFTFEGSETIEIEISNPTYDITLNCIEIDVQSASLTLPDGTPLPSSGINYNEDEETATFSFGSQIPVGGAQLSIDFKGELNDKLRGFYRSEYTDIDGNERSVVHFVV